MMHEKGRNGFLLGLTAQIVSAHVAHNPVKGADLPRLIQAVHQSLAELQTQALRAPEMAKDPCEEETWH